MMDVPDNLPELFHEISKPKIEEPKIISLTDGLVPARPGSSILVPKGKGDTYGFSFLSGVDSSYSAALSLWDQMYSAFPSFSGASCEPAPPKNTVDESKIATLKAAEPRRVSPPKRIPDSIQAIVAWRSWAVADGDEELRLNSLAQETEWEPRKQLTAQCSGHKAPAFDHTCGIWSFKTFDLLMAAIQGSYTPQVLGSVYLWGRVIECENGFRAQYAYPAELWLLDNSLEELGWIYNVPVRTT